MIPKNRMLRLKFTEKIYIYNSLSWGHSEGKTAFYSIQYKNYWKRKFGCFWPFCLHKQLPSMHSIVILKSNEVWKKVIRQIDRKWRVAPIRKFYRKFELVFVLRQENAFSLRSLFKANRKSIGSSTWEIGKIKTFFRKREYCFLVESTKIEKATFSYKTAQSEANVKTNRMSSRQWTYHKEQRFASNYFIFWKFCFSLRTPYKSWFEVPTTQMCIFILLVSAGALLEGNLSLWVSLSKRELRNSSNYPSAANQTVILSCKGRP